ncbi:MAG: putative porin [Immundisolibacter sp.]|uniref:putative porin n=1 Tax=Immundisolibacter sp. TaxID=1934948 RepID=UPI003D151B87
MRPVTARTAGLLGGLLLAAAPAFAGTVDQKLLDMLLANGSINAAQHAELTGDLATEQRKAARADAKQVKTEDMVALQQKLGWAMNTQLRGDVRARYENVHIEDEPDTGRDQDRQRIRARIGAFTQVNPEVEAGIQIATGSSDDRRSTNQSLEGAFSKKSVWLDLGYIDYHPLAVPGLKVFGGKMKQPWVSLGDIIWDGDTNPEGAAASYSRKWGMTELFGSGGYFVLTDNVDGDGRQFEHDLRLYSGQIGTRFYPGDSFKVTLGGSVYAYDNDDEVTALRANGNNQNEFRLLETFGQLDVIGLPLPLSVYGQFVQNTAATGVDADQDQAWLVGVMTRLFDVGIDYNYRDVQRNGVVGAFTDSDFADGYVGSRGHKLKLRYDINKNFAFTTTYFMAESDVASRFTDDASVNRLQVDLEAKF